MSKTSRARLRNTLLSLALAASLTGCATDCKVLVPQQPVRNPKPDPSLMVAPTTVNYSARAQNDMKAWREMQDASPSK